MFHHVAYLSSLVAQGGFPKASSFSLFPLFPCPVHLSLYRPPPLSFLPAVRITPARALLVSCSSLLQNTVTLPNLTPPSCCSSHPTTLSHHQPPPTHPPVVHYLPWFLHIIALPSLRSGERQYFSPCGDSREILNINSAHSLGGSCHPFLLFFLHPLIASRKSLRAALPRVSARAAISSGRTIPPEALLDLFACVFHRRSFLWDSFIRCPSWVAERSRSRRSRMIATAQCKC